MRKIFIMLLSLFLLSSCKLVEKFRGDNKENENSLQYMKNIEQVALEEAEKNKLSPLQPGDELLIMVSAKDMDVAKPFNQNYSSGELIQQGSNPSGNINTQRPSTAGPHYRINSEGNIDFPILGLIPAKGKTVDELTDYLRGRISRYIINPSVNVKITNFRVTILGEVKNPGKFIVSDGQSTLMDALGMAGDLTIFAKRDDILVVRNESGNIEKGRINISDASFLNSPYYNLKQGDVIYVAPNKTQERISKRDPNNTIYISIASILVTILALIIRK